MCAHCQLEQHTILEFTQSRRHTHKHSLPAIGAAVKASVLTSCAAAAEVLEDSFDTPRSDTTHTHTEQQQR